MLARMFSGSLPSRRDEKVKSAILLHKMSILLRFALSELPFKQLLNASTSLQGRVFLDRDPKHFRLILNYLRDGNVCLPQCAMELQEIVQEAMFYQVAKFHLLPKSSSHWHSSICVSSASREYRFLLPLANAAICSLPQCSVFLQLDELRSLISGQERWLPQSAAQLRTSISEQLQVCILALA